MTFGVIGGLIAPACVVCGQMWALTVTSFSGFTHIMQLCYTLYLVLEFLYVYTCIQVIERLLAFVVFIVSYVVHVYTMYIHVSGVPT